MRLHRPYSLAQPMRAGALIGVGFVAAIDEIIFHQLLGWHHFYDLATPTIGLISDGILHAAELLCLAAGFIALIDMHRKSTLAITPVIAGFLCGMGGFQLFDGVINHKILRIHQIRYDVDLLPYDIIWNLIGISLLLAGLWTKYYYSKSIKENSNGN